MSPFCKALLTGALAFAGSAAWVDAATVPLTVCEQAGIARPNGHVTSGVPFPQGQVSANSSYRLVSDEGRELPLQFQVTGTWPDGSVKWVLLDFPVQLAARETLRFTLETTTSGAASAPPGAGTPRPRGGPGPLKLHTDSHGIHADTGPLRLTFSRSSPAILQRVDLHADSGAARTVLENALAPSLEFANDELHRFRAEAPVELNLEESGPLRAVVNAFGWFVEQETNRVVRYITRATVLAGSPQIQVQHTIVQLSDRHKLLHLLAHSLSLPSRKDVDTHYVFGGNQVLHSGLLSSNGAVVKLVQLEENNYRLNSGDRQLAEGLKAPGWVRLQTGNSGTLVMLRHFWQQFPKSIELAPGLLRLGLHPAAAGRPFDFDQGLAKTHELLLSFLSEGMTPQQCRNEHLAFENPLFAVAPASWYCDTKVFGDLLPFDFDRFPDYETLTEVSADQVIRRMATGIRNWGDLYYGGEFKGTNSYMNLEYDMPHNFLVQFARTGLSKYLQTATLMAQHQADIDTNHKTGWQWKHSPRHVEVQAEFGHTFTRGLLETWFLTGNRRCLEAAVELGDFFAKDIRNPRALGNERQIGWALISLLPVYEATWDPNYFLAASNTVERLLQGLGPDGKFTIRWDNRIAFFNGIAATGLLYYYRATGDERVADAAFRVIRRARGFYPEYNGRTLEAIAWAYQRNPEPEWLDFLARTWETTMARQLSWNVMELGAPTIFTVHALPFLTESNLLPRDEQPLALSAAQLSSENGLHAHHVPWGEAELYLQPIGTGPTKLVLIRKGAWKAPGTAALYNLRGSMLAALDLPKENLLWQRRAISLGVAEPGAWYRLALRSPPLLNLRNGSYITWDVVTSRPTAAVFVTPGFSGLEFITPALYAMPTPGATQIELEVSARGEGFKRALICAPDGSVAGAVDAFIDLGDKRSCTYTVSAKIPPTAATSLWSIVLQDVQLDKVSGLNPGFSRSKASFFAPMARSK